MKKINKNNILNYIKLVRPNAKFVEVVTSDVLSLDSKGQNEDIANYHYISLYDENISATATKYRGEYLLVQNTYLSSFAYNLNLCYLYAQKYCSSEVCADQQNVLLHHNLKKFFAEQFYNIKNCQFSRKILLETLIFEQKIMIDIFAKTETDQEFKEQASFSGGIMSNLLSTHELGHIWLDYSSETWAILAKEEGAYFKAFTAEYVDNISDANVLEEVQCDIISVLLSTKNNDSNFSNSYIINSIIFGFISFIPLFSLQDSARLTASRVDNQADKTNFKNIGSNYVEFDPVIIENEGIVFRANVVIQFLKAYAHHHEIAILEECLEFPIHEALLARMKALSLTILQKNVLITDNEDALANLLAEAFNGHRKGVDYLYIRSKKFRSNKEEHLCIE